MLINMSCLVFAAPSTVVELGFPADVCVFLSSRQVTCMIVRNNRMQVAPCLLKMRQMWLFLQTSHWWGHKKEDGAQFHMWILPPLLYCMCSLGCTVLYYWISLNSTLWCDGSGRLLCTSGIICLCFLFCKCSFVLTPKAGLISHRSIPIKLCSFRAESGALLRFASCAVSTTLVSGVRLTVVQYFH